MVSIAGYGNAGAYGCALGYNGDGMLAIQAALGEPYGVAVNSLNEVYIADTGARRVRKILLNGTIVTIAGDSGSMEDGVLALNALLDNPYSVHVNSMDQVIVSDTNNNRVVILKSCPSNSNQLGDSCLCESGYFGIGPYCNLFNCSGIISSSDLVCSSRGSCRKPNTCTNLIMVSMV